MTAQEEQISRIEKELNGARRDLRETISAVNAKVEHAEEELRPDRLVERYPVGASCLAGALGFFVGSNAKNRIVGPLMILALLGYAISKGRPEDRRRPDRTKPDRSREDDDGEARSDD
jgi:hypothetical protein